MILSYLLRGFPECRNILNLYWIKASLAATKATIILTLFSIAFLDSQLLNTYFLVIILLFSFKLFEFKVEFMICQKAISKSSLVSAVKWIAID